MLTVNPLKAFRARAHKAVHVFVAGGPVLAGAAGAFVHVRLTALPFKSRTTSAGKTRNLVHTRASVQAGVCGGERGAGRR